jgi:hypothetical protein
MSILWLQRAKINRITRSCRLESELHLNVAYQYPVAEDMSYLKDSYARKLQSQKNDRQSCDNSGKEQNTWRWQRYLKNMLTFTFFNNTYSFSSFCLIVFAH